MSVARASAPEPLIASQTAAAARQDGASAASAQSRARIVAATINEQAKLVPSDGTADDAFGSRVSLSGDRALIGAFHDTDNGDNSGAAYVFVFDGTTWREEAKLKPSDGGEQDGFGFSVSLSGDRALIGAYNDQDNGAGGGSAYVFAFDGTTWNQEAKLFADDEVAGDFFGSSVSLSGKRALVGATENSSDGPSAAYLFFFDGARWNQQLKLTPSDGPIGDFNSISVSLSGKRVLVGTADSAGDGGAAYVFGRGSQRQ